MEHIISIQTIDNTVGIPQSTDGIMMQFVKAVAVAGTFALNTAYLLTGMEDLAALGIDDTYDTTNGTCLYQNVSEYYGEAGDGKLLWLVGVATATNYATFVASSTFSNLLQFTGSADPANRAKVLGFSYMPPVTLQQATDFPADVAATVTALQTVQQQLFQLGYMFSAIVDGYNMSSTVTPSNLGTYATNTAFSVSLCITGTQPNGVSSVGLALGRLAVISIGTSIGRVKDGGINTLTAYLTNSIVVQAGTNMVVGETMTVFGGVITYNSVVYQIGAQFAVVEGELTFTTAASGYVAANCTPVKEIPGTNVIGLSATDINQLGQKQFLFIRWWFAQSGLYWNDGATCVASTKAFSTQEYNRVVNSLSADALLFFIQEINDGCPLDKTTGNVAQAWLNAKQEEFYDEFIQPLSSANGGTGDITDGALVVTGINFLATKTLAFALTVVPTVTMGSVSGTVQFSATL